MSDPENTSSVLDKRLVRRAFDRAANSYDAHAALQRHVVDHLLDSLDVIQVTPTTILDIGAGTGYCAQSLRNYYRKTQIVLLDISERMLTTARAKAPRWRARQTYLCADAEQLPLADQSVDMVFSSLSMQWVNNLDAALEDCWRVLKPNGLLIFSSLGPDTLRELRSAWRAVDDSPRVNTFIDMHDVGDAIVRAGFASPVLECDPITVNYRDTKAVMHDLRGIGAINRQTDRARGLATKRAFDEMSAAYEAFRVGEDLPATYEVVYAHAWRPQKDERPQDGSTVATFPFSDLKRRAP